MAINSLEMAPTGTITFHLVIIKESKELANLLFESGLRETALCIAMASWQDELILILISIDFDVNGVGKNFAGQTALHIVAWYDYKIATQVS